MGRERHLFLDDTRDHAQHVRRPGFSARWERVDADEPRNLPILLRQASSAVDRMVLRALTPVLEPVLGPLTSRTMIDIDLLVRVAVKPVAPIQLAEYLDRHRSTITHRLDHLEAAGLIDRLGSGNGGGGGGRRCVVDLTDAGRDLAHLIDQTLTLLADEISEDLPPTRWAPLLDDLSTLADVR